ncbi:Serine/threonine-protein kinase Kist [Perkinsus chesapeaki]|uniref:Serine/threonine-protein kinase Kist n=1 Tax=Perkinsus chesapeaki TaxID=330153 RepID=A0A7J6LU52_PERCH|nr:Serine/threonine-protein kinase Kist [Perkinsus chesapeaki]
MSHRTKSALEGTERLCLRYEETGDIIYGQGFTCVVTLAKDKLTRKEVAVKAILKSKLYSPVELERAEAEVAWHSGLFHPYILPVLDTEETAKSLVLVMPYAPMGDLYHLTKCATSPELAVRNCMSQLVSALDYLHRKGLVHGDIKPHNVLVYERQGRLIVQLCDFGFTEPVREDTQKITFTTLRGTSGYFAPEQLAKKSYDGAVDMFALGITAFTMLCGYEPFYPLNVFHEPIEFNDDCWSGISDDAKDFLRRCLKLDPTERLSAGEALRHPWLDLTTQLPCGADADLALDFWHAAEAAAEGLDLNLNDWQVAPSPRTKARYPDGLSLCGDLAAGPSPLGHTDKDPLLLLKRSGAKQQVLAGGQR